MRVWKVAKVCLPSLFDSIKFRREWKVDKVHLPSFFDSIKQVIDIGEFPRKTTLTNVKVKVHQTIEFCFIHAECHKLVFLTDIF